MITQLLVLFLIYSSIADLNYFIVAIIFLSFHVKVRECIKKMLEYFLL